MAHAGLPQVSRLIVSGWSRSASSSSSLPTTTDHASCRSQDREMALAVTQSVRGTLRRITLPVGQRKRQRQKDRHAKTKINCFTAYLDQWLVLIKGHYNMWVILTGTILLSSLLSYTTFRPSHCILQILMPWQSHYCVVSVSFLAPLQRTLTPIAPYGEMFLYNNPEGTPVRQRTLPLVDSE